MKFENFTNNFLFSANVLLLCLGWLLAFYSYPRLPQAVPLWVNLFGEQPLLMKKNLFFFVYPLAQTVFCLAFWLAARFSSLFRFVPHKGELVSPEQENALFKLRKEFIYLALIFFNLIFIHLQKSIIFIAHGIRDGVNRVYFFSILAFLILLIPLYRLRLRLLASK
ncbi:MAG: hypothetical protein ACE5LC_08090 [Candidatus Aminicenantales bacterium]